MTPEQWKWIQNTLITVLFLGWAIFAMVILSFLVLCGMA